MPFVVSSDSLSYPSSSSRTSLSIQYLEPGWMAWKKHSEQGRFLDIHLALGLRKARRVSGSSRSYLRYDEAWSGPRRDGAVLSLSLRLLDMIPPLSRHLLLLPNLPSASNHIYIYPYLRLRLVVYFYRVPSSFLSLQAVLSPLALSRQYHLFLKPPVHI